MTTVLAAGCVWVFGAPRPHVLTARLRRRGFDAAALTPGICVRCSDPVVTRGEIDSILASE